MTFKKLELENLWHFCLIEINFLRYFAVIDNYRQKSCVYPVSMKILLFVKILNVRFY